MKLITTQRGVFLALVIALLTALVLPAAAQRRQPERPGPGRGAQPAIPSGSVGVRATLTAVNAAAGTIQISTRDGLTATLKTSSSTVIRRDNRTATLADLKPNDTVLVVYDRTSLVASRIEAASPPPTTLTGTITAYTAPTAAAGTTPAAPGSLQVTSDHGTAITLTVDSTSQARLNGRATTAGSIAAGQQVRVTYRPENKIALTIDAATPRAGVVSGAITALDQTAGTLQLTPLVGTVPPLKLNAQTQYRLNGRPVAPGAIAVGYLASAQVAADNTAQIVAAETPPLVNLVGTISALNVQGNTVQITTPAQTTITLLLGSFTTVQKDNATSAVDRLSMGDQVQVRYEYRLIPNTSRALRIVATSAAPATPAPTTPTPANPAPTTPANPALTVTLNPATVTGGNPVTVTVTLPAAAPATGATVTLTSSNPAVALAPASAPVQANATSATVQIATAKVLASTTVTITATSGGATGSAMLTINP